MLVNAVCELRFIASMGPRRTEAPRKNVSEDGGRDRRVRRRSQARRLRSYGQTYRAQMYFASGLQGPNYRPPSPSCVASHEEAAISKIGSTMDARNRSSNCATEVKAAAEMSEASVTRLGSSRRCEVRQRYWNGSSMKRVGCLAACRLGRVARSCRRHSAGK